MIVTIEDFNDLKKLYDNGKYNYQEYLKLIKERLDELTQKDNIKSDDIINKKLLINM